MSDARRLIKHLDFRAVEFLDHDVLEEQGGAFRLEADGAGQVRIASAFGYHDAIDLRGHLAVGAGEFRGVPFTDFFSRFLELVAVEFRLDVSILDAEVEDLAMVTV